jgi:neurofibromin 1
MIGDKGELPIAMALSNVVTSQQMDELARVFVTLFDAKHLLSPLLWNMFYREVDVSECMQVGYMFLISVLFNLLRVFKA